tara:strand:+ start:327 stop:1022 length:696 start_codon:yes stop_codon:yes gene_type:complete
MDELLEIFGGLAAIEQAVGDQYELDEGKIGVDKGKIQLRPKIKHGMAMAPETLRSLALAIIQADAGESLVDNRKRVVNTDLEYALENLMSGQGLAQLGKGGLREKVDNALRAERGKTIARALDLGYNQKTGAPFGSAGLDAGHIQSHKDFPELSTSAANIMPENKYENRAKGAAPDEQVADRLHHSLIKRIRDSHTMVPYSDAAVAEMAAGPEIMQVNRKEYLKGKRAGRF